MTHSKKKRFQYISILSIAAGVLSITLVAYFFIQTIRESFYQSHFDKRYEFISLEEDGIIDPVQVFHGVKLNTFEENLKENSRKKPDVIFEVKDEQVVALKGRELHSKGEGMRVFADMIQYKTMVDNQTGKESFIIAMQLNSPNEIQGSAPAKYRTYSINENGVIKKSDFTLKTKSKMETQWIRGLSGESYGYYTNLPHQKGSTTSMIFLSVIGIALLLAGIWIRKWKRNNDKGTDAMSQIS
ncbi:hypothetical protein CN378_12980 [Bacillus sp. AFS015802]|uniref:hypothetical protein n=1 Tax=Bacillus sp. AFS015802 TaxID=2033486 RepID=UPI000BF33A24|nr:hypothetical protein [Bacillus sp. AFS015802]PFA66806.1 hypothetical protein CN378_12980 [Bacillus sp. AFS015802]